jgi:hypothetical protein
MTTAKYADIRDRDLMASYQREGIGLLAATTASVVFGVVMVGWVAFSEITRCDPCEWVQHQVGAAP